MLIPGPDHVKSENQELYYLNLLLSGHKHNQSRDLDDSLQSWLWKTSEIWNLREFIKWFLAMAPKWGSLLGGGKNFQLTFPITTASRALLSVPNLRLSTGTETEGKRDAHLGSLRKQNFLRERVSFWILENYLWANEHESEPTTWEIRVPLSRSFWKGDERF